MHTSSLWKTPSIIENARSICRALEDEYAHFLYVDLAISEKQYSGNLGKLLIVSKSSFALVDSNPVTTNAVDFIIGTYYWQEDANALVLSFLTEELGSDYAVSTHPVRILGQSEGLLAHIVKNSSCFLQSSSDTLLTYQVSLYSQGLYMKYYNPAQNVVLARRGDREVGGSVTGSLDITIRQDGHIDVTGRLSGEVHDRRGNHVEGRVEYNKDTGDTRIGISGGHEESRETLDGSNDK